MNSLSFASFLAMALLATQSGAQFIIHTPPSATTCSPLRVTWTGGEAPYHLRIFPGQQPNSTVLRDLGEHSGLSTTWNVNVNGGTSVVFNLRDSSQNTAWSGAFTVNAGADTSCIDSSGGSVPSTSSSVTPATSGSASTGVTGLATASGISANTTSTLPVSSTVTSTGSAEASPSVPTSIMTTNTLTVPNPSASISITGSGITSAPATTSQSSGNSVRTNGGLAVIAALFALLG
ncbi:hypothetical protein BDZ94DRAFT_1247111 [Collybia nuda]|uniref:Extracellular matrix protein n=1 Tax=Collybia nuda TaxID=64659 RepID=A0A9P6CNA3_9AGAR|nr:hypothetical protein BDZ94DRAFT_1247111 [Collybia nuda]